MFEGSLISLLAADGDLQTLLSEFSGAPAIFSRMAPQKAERPYIGKGPTAIGTRLLIHYLLSQAK